jgi:hypothetical protein
MVLIPWKTCKAKQILIQDLEIGMIGMANDDPTPLSLWPFYHDNMPDFQYIEYDQFKGGLDRLRAKMQLSVNRLVDEEAGLVHDMQLFPRSHLNYRGEPHWDVSDAKTLLDQDIDNEWHTIYEPKELWLTRPEYYNVYPLEIFRKHIHQEVRSRKFLVWVEWRRREYKKKHGGLSEDELSDDEELGDDGNEDDDVNEDDDEDEMDML